MIKVMGSPMIVIMGTYTWSGAFSSKKSINPIKNRTSDRRRRTGSAENICGTCHSSRPLERILKYAKLSWDVPRDEDRWYSLSHCSPTIPPRAIVKLSTRLVSHRTLTREIAVDGFAAKLKLGPKKGKGRPAADVPF